MLPYCDEDKTYSQVFPNTAAASYVKIILRECELWRPHLVFNVMIISAIKMVNLLQRSIISCK